MKLSQFAAFFIVIASLSFAPSSFSRKGDWTSSGAPMMPVPTPPNQKILKCQDATQSTYVLSVAASNTDLKIFGRGQVDHLNGVLEVNSTTLGNMAYSVTVTKETSQKNFFRADIDSATVKRNKVLPVAFYFYKSLGKQNIHMLVKTPNGMQEMPVNCQSTWLFFRL